MKLKNSVVTSKNKVLSPLLNPDGEFEDAYFEPVAKGMSNEEIDGKVANAIGEFLASDDRWTKHKQVFELFVTGVKQQEIAAKLNITQGRVAQIIKEIGKDKDIQEVETHYPRKHLLQE